MQLRERSAVRRCPLCLDTLGGGTEESVCAGCDTAYHAPCLDELGGCASAGCKQSSPAAVAHAAGVREKVEASLVDAILAGEPGPSYPSGYLRLRLAVGVAALALTGAVVLAAESSSFQGAVMAGAIAIFGLFLAWALSGVGDSDLR